MAIVAVVQAPETVLSSPLIAWAGFLFVAAASLIYTPEPSAGLRALLSLITYAAVFTLPLAIIRTGRQFAQCLTVALGSSLVPSAVALIEIATQPAILTGHQRLQSTFTHPNIFAFYIVSVVTTILYMHCSSNITITTFVRRATFIYATLLLTFLLFTQTRSAWISMLLIVLGYSVMVDRRWLIAILVLPTALLIPAVAERLADLQSGTIDAGFEQLNSLAWRETLWTDTLEWLSANPPGFLGYGLGGYKSYVPLFFTQLSQAFERTRDDAAVGAHNALLQIYFEMGIAGLVSFALLMSTIATKLLFLSGRDFAGAFTILMMCGGYVLVAYSDNLLDYLQFQWFFWFTLGTMCASRRFVALKPELILA